MLAPWAIRRRPGLAAKARNEKGRSMRPDRLRPGHIVLLIVMGLLLIGLFSLYQG
jgi:hypothetical protein